MENHATPTRSRTTKLPCSCVIALAALVAFGAFCGCAGAGDNGSQTAESPEASSSAVQSSSTASDSVDDDATSPSSASASSASASSAGSSSAWQSDSELAKRLKADIKQVVKNSGMNMGVCVIDLESGERANLSGNKRMVSASMIKLPIAACLLTRVGAGELSFDDTYVLKESDIVGGTGSLGGRGPDAETTYGELLELMIAESDNTATNIIIETVGMDTVNDVAKDLGLASTELNRLMMDENAIAEGIENYTSANDVAAILERAYRGELVSPKASKRLIKALRKQVDETGIRAGLPEDVTFAHKTGQLAGVQNDGGIVEAERDFVVVTLCGGDGFTFDGALEAMADIGRVTYRDIVKTN